MHPFYLIASLFCTVAIVFGLQGTALGRNEDDPTNALQPVNLYEMKPSIQQQISTQINKELHASNKYLAIAAYFGQDNVNLLGFKKFFMDNSKEEKGHADKLVDYLNGRNGRLTSITVETVTYTGTTGLKALQDALELEKDVTRHLMTLHKTASSSKLALDVHLVDFLESEMLREQVESMRKLEGYIANLKRMSGENNDNLAEFLFDRQLKD